MNPFIERIILADLISHLDKKEITLIIGPRQAGKTTLLKKLEIQLKEQGKKTVFFNLDFDEQRIYFKKQLDLINYLKLNLGDERGYVFIDEIQRLENAGLFLKGLYDRDLPYKFIVSGSGSLELKDKIYESLVGRKRIFEINTISFKEFVNWKTGYKYQNNLNNFFSYDKTLPDILLNEYLSFGGYPRIVLSETIDEKKAMIKDIYQSYLEKDIQSLIKLEKKEVFSQLVIILAKQIGQLVNIAEFSRTLAIDQETVKRYLWLLEKTFIINKIRPFFINPRKELSKTPIYYFNDLGLRNYSLNQWIVADLFRINGFLFQNFIFLLLKNHPVYKDAKINYWRTKDQAEVDFILNFNEEIIPIEVKDTHLVNYKISLSLRNFILKYHPKKVLIINKSMKKKTTFGKTTIEIIPYYYLII